MSKTPSKKLYDLIHSLTAAEKRHFRLFASKYRSTNKYLLLFDIIDQHTQFDEGVFMKEIYQTDDIEGKKYSELKNYLYKLIIKSLQYYDELKSVEYTLEDYLRGVRVLYRRGHYKDCRALLKKARTMAYEYEDFSTIIAIIRWEKQIAYTLIDVGFLDKYREMLHREEQHCIQQLTNVSEYRHIFYDVLVSIKKEAFLSSTTKKNALQHILSHPLMQGNEQAQSYYAKLLYYRIYALYYSVILDYPQFYECSTHVVATMESKPHLLAENKSEYISSLSNLVLSCGLLKKYEEVNNVLEKLKSIEPDTLDDELKIHRQYYLNKFSLIIAQGDFASGELLLVAHWRESEKFDQQLFERGIFYFQYFYIYFGVSDYGQALFYLNHWLNQGKTIERQDLQSIARILNIIIHLEMGNYLLIEHLLKTTHRFLDKQQRLFAFERYFLQYIKIVEKQPPRQTIQKALLQLREQLAALQALPSESVIFQYFNFLAWIDSKIHHTTFGEAIRALNQ
ncbi:MAG: hypothetical protein KA974_06975 [Saprospiraceae bacterium]|nr:hypothetical protein [Saprospiraceae bacterium]MBP7699858.1 hypothetical protein [Saprospiraceae bacterium]